jgi:two-component system, chemotaxis family, CheB/CheR fusion protein
MGETVGSFGQAVARDAFAGVLAAIQVPLLVIDAHMRGRSSNRAFQEAFGLSSRACVGESVFALLGGAFDLPELRTALSETLAKRRAFRALETSRPVPGRGMMTFAVSGGATVSPAGAQMLVLSFEIWRREGLA